jgi:hypothetical protein
MLLRTWSRKSPHGKAGQQDTQSVGSQRHDLAFLLQVMPRSHSVFYGRVPSDGRTSQRAPRAGRTSVPASVKPVFLNQFALPFAAQRQRPAPIAPRQSARPHATGCIATVVSRNAAGLRSDVTARKRERQRHLPTRRATELPTCAQPPIAPLECSLGAGARLKTQREAVMGTRTAGWRLRGTHPTPEAPCPGGRLCGRSTRACEGQTAPGAWPSCCGQVD